MDCDKYHNENFKNQRYERFKYKINGNLYTVNINQIEDNIATVEVNGTPYKVELDKPAKKQTNRSPDRRQLPLRLPENRS